jgi:hypothetical protein
MPKFRTKVHCLTGSKLLLIIMLGLLLHAMTRVGLFFDMDHTRICGLFLRFTCDMGFSLSDQL